MTRKYIPVEEALVVARLESGRVLPSTRTLERFAKATHTRLRISFEPDTSGREAPC